VYVYDKPALKNSVTYKCIDDNKCSVYGKPVNKCSVYDKPALKNSVTYKFIDDKVINKCSVYGKPVLLSTINKCMYMTSLP